MKQSYDFEKVMSYAVAVNELQGFVASGNGYYDNEKTKMIYDNKTVITGMLDGLPEFQDIEVNDSHAEKAREISEHFQTSMALKKLSGELNSFEERVSDFIMNTAVDRFGVSVAASLPQSYAIDQKREAFNEQMSRYKKTSKFQGSIGQRMSMVVEIIDMKYLRNFGSYVVTSIYDDAHIIKFFWNKDPDLTGVLEGKTVKITAKVKQHETSRYSNADETMVNYVKIDEIKG